MASAYLFLVTLLLQVLLLQGAPLQKENIDSACKGKLNGHHSAAGDCTKFLLCVDEKPYYLNCPHGLHWSDASGHCDVVIRASCHIVTEGDDEESSGDDIAVTVELVDYGNTEEDANKKDEIDVDLPIERIEEAEELVVHENEETDVEESSESSVDESESSEDKHTEADTNEMDEIQDDYPQEEGEEGEEEEEEEETKADEERYREKEAKEIYEEEEKIKAEEEAENEKEIEREEREMKKVDVQEEEDDELMEEKEVDEDKEAYLDQEATSKNGGSGEKSPSLVDTLMDEVDEVVSFF